MIEIKEAIKDAEGSGLKYTNTIIAALRTMEWLQRIGKGNMIGIGVTLKQFEDYQKES
jgi:hypothetical protein